MPGRCVGLLPCSEKNESASGPIAAPVSAAQISSKASASVAPFAPPMGNRLPRLDRLLRIGGRLAVPVERPAFGNLLALGHRDHDLAARHRGHGEVDHDRIGVLAREGERHRIGAEQRLLSAPRRDRGRRIGEGDADHAGLGHLEHMDAEHADVRAVADAGEADAVAPGALDHFIDRPGGRLVGQAVGVVDQAHRALVGDDLRPGRADGAAVLQHAAVERHARHAVRGQALRLGPHQVLGGSLGHPVVRAGALQRLSRKSKQFLGLLLHN